MLHDSCNDVDYRTQRQLHFDWAAGEAIHDYTDPDGAKVILVTNDIDQP